MVLCHCRMDEARHIQASQRERIRAIDLFCGGGGSSWGACRAGIKIVAGFDAWEVAERNHAANFPDAQFFLGRLEGLNVREVARQVGKIDLILASPECTNHSPAKGSRPRCELSKETAFEVVRFARVLMPRWIVVENVLSMKRWTRYAEFKATLSKLDYKLSEQSLDSADFHVPQKRRRLFLLCDRVQVPPKIRPIGGTPRSVRAVVSLNGDYKWTPLLTPRRAEATLTRAQRAVDSLGSSRPFLLVYYGSDHAGGWQTLSRPLRTITTLDRFALVKPSKKGHLMRMLQVPELQMAMGMDGMEFPHGTRRDRIKIIGNAVCPPVMTAVIQQLTASE